MKEFPKQADEAESETVKRMRVLATWYQDI